MPDGSDSPAVNDPVALLERCEEAFESSRGHRNNWEMARRVFFPVAAPFTFTHDGFIDTASRDREAIVDTYPQFAARVHATFLFGSIINGDSDWFKVVAEARGPNRDMAKDSEVLRWADEYRDELADVVMNASTGFVDEYYAMLLERTVFGNGRLYGGDRPGALPIVRCSPMCDSAWEAGIGHEPDAHWWRQSLTAGEWKRKFPKKMLGEQLESCASTARGRSEPFTFIHGVLENPEWQPMVPDQQPRQRKFLTVWINERDRTLISENWLRTNPYEPFRCQRRAGESYGRGPADEGLEEANMVQRVRVGVIRGIEKTVDPVLLLPDDGVITTPTSNAREGIMIKSELLMRGLDPVKYLRSEARPDIGQEFLRDNCYGSIDRAFSRDLMTLPREPRMLDSQIIGLQEEQSRGVVPIIAPLFAPTARFLGRIADICQRQGRLPRPPETADGLTISIEFRNPLERASRLAEVRAFMQALSILIQAVQVDPGARHAIKVVEGVQYCARVLGVPETLITGATEMAKLLDADRQAARQKAGMEQTLDASTVIKNAGPSIQGMMTPPELASAA